MSTFGSPGARAPLSRPVPPERGSFPLDHDGECKHIMTHYLRCIKAHRGENAAECRDTARSYLQCRMDRNLMAPDEMKNLGFGAAAAAGTAAAAADGEGAAATGGSSSSSSTSTSTSSTAGLRPGGKV